MKVKYYKATKKRKDSRNMKTLRELLYFFFELTYITVYCQYVLNYLSKRLIA